MSRFIDKIRKAKQAQERAAQAAQSAGAPASPADGDPLVPEQDKPSPAITPEPAGPPTPEPLFPDAPTPEVARVTLPDEEEPVFPPPSAKRPPRISIDVTPPPDDTTIPDDIEVRPRSLPAIEAPQAPDLMSILPDEVEVRPRSVPPVPDKSEMANQMSILPDEVVVRPRAEAPKVVTPATQEPLVPGELGVEDYDRPVRKVRDEEMPSVEASLIPEDIQPPRRTLPVLNEAVIDPEKTLEEHYLRGLTDYSREETLRERRSAAEELDEWSSIQRPPVPDDEPVAEIEAPSVEARELPDESPLPSVAPSVPAGMGGARISHSPVAPAREHVEPPAPPIEEAEVSAGLWDATPSDAPEEKEPEAEPAPTPRARTPREPLYPSELETKSFFIGDEPESDDPVFTEKTIPVHVPAAERKMPRETPIPPAASADPDYVKRIATIALRPDKRIISYYSPADHVCEEYRLLGKNIMHTFAEGPPSKRGRIVSLTSAVRGEGKTLTSVNLSMTVAQDLSDRVLLIDGDLRHPRVHRYLGIPGGTGFNDLVASADPASILDKCVVRTETGLHLLLCSAVGKSPSPVLDSRQMNQVLQLVRDRYSLIIIDTPPVLLATDALTLGVKSDGMLFLMRARKTQREQVQEARQRIARLDIRLLGYVINNVKTFLPRIWSRYYYGNY